MKILMVCLGNICRSPLAEGIMKAKAVDHNLDYKVDSAGTATYHVGEQPDIRSIETARKHGIDISQQRSRQFAKNDFSDFDIIFVMDKANYQDITNLASDDNQRAKVRLIRNETKKTEDKEVPDPYYGGKEGFENVYLMLEKACQNFIEKQNP